MPGDISGTFGDRTDPATPVQGCGNSTPADGDMTDLIRTAIGPLPFRDSRRNTGHISTFRPDNHVADFLCPEKLCTYLPYDIRASPLVTGTSRNGCPKTPLSAPPRGQANTGNHYPRPPKTPSSRKPNELPGTGALCKTTIRSRRVHAPPAFAAAPMHPRCPVRPRTRILSRRLGPQ